MDVKLSRKGWVVIPATLREKYKLKAGVLIQFVDYGGVLALVPAAQDPIEEAAGAIKGGSLTEALLTEHRRELGNER